jgi:galactoside O-acetyltransferase
MIKVGGTKMTQRERMDKGLIYDPGDAEIMKEQVACLEYLYDFNATRPSEYKKREELLKNMFGKIGKGCYIEPPFHANFGGRHVYMGDYVYANFNLTLVDDGNIYIGDKVMFGPNVTVATANHPIAPELREKQLQYNKDIHIGNNVWIGSGVIIVPGITIGDNSVIGAGSIVTKDIPANVVAYGNPCRIAREINEHDREFFYKKEAIDWENL